MKEDSCIISSTNLNIDLGAAALVVAFQLDLSKWTVKIPKEKLTLNAFVSITLSWHPMTGLKVSYVSRVRIFGIEGIQCSMNSYYTFCSLAVSNSVGRSVYLLVRENAKYEKN